MKTRVEAVYHALELEKAKKLNAFQDEIKSQALGQWDVKPLVGKGVEIEQKILDILVDEKMETVAKLLSEYPMIIDGFIRKEMLARKPESLKMELL